MALTSMVLRSIDPSLSQHTYDVTESILSQSLERKENPVLLVASHGVDTSFKQTSQPSKSYSKVVWKKHIEASAGSQNAKEHPDP